MKNAYRLSENIISESQLHLSGQTPGNSSLRGTQLPPVGLANVSGSTGGRENEPQAMVQEATAGTTLLRQSRAGAFPNLGARHNRVYTEVQTSKTASGSGHLYCSAIRNAIKTEETPLRRLLKRYWICLSYASQVSVSASFWLGYVWRNQLCPAAHRHYRGSQQCRRMICTSVARAWPYQLWQEGQKSPGRCLPFAVMYKPY